VKIVVETNVLVSGFFFTGPEERGLEVKDSRV
jgi:hypothetical protein